MQEEEKQMERRPDWWMMTSVFSQSLFLDPDDAVEFT
jgi:hypothetical protein